MNPLFRIDFSISDSLKIVRKSVLIYETIIQIPSACPHLVFYIPFFMPGVCITKPNPEAIVGTEAGEHFVSVIVSITL